MTTKRNLKFTTRPAEGKYSPEDFETIQSPALRRVMAKVVLTNHTAHHNEFPEFPQYPSAIPESKK